MLRRIVTRSNVDNHETVQSIPDEDKQISSQPYRQGCAHTKRKSLGLGRRSKPASHRPWKRWCYLHHERNPRGCVDRAKTLDVKSTYPWLRTSNFGENRAIHEERLWVEHLPRTRFIEGKCPNSSFDLEQLKLNVFIGIHFLVMRNVRIHAELTFIRRLVFIRHLGFG